MRCAVLIDKLKKETKKHPRWQRMFLSWINEDEKVNIQVLINYFLLFKRYKNVLQLNPTEINLLVKDKPACDAYKNIIIKEINNYKSSKLINTLKTTKLYNNKIENKIKKIDQTKIDALIKIIKKNRCITSDELFELINTFNDENSNWNKDYYLNKIKINNLNVYKIDETSNSLLIDALDYRSCQLLGSIDWCIVKSEQKFRNYKSKMRSQYIYLDFNKQQSDPNSLIGFSVMTTGHISDSYLKDNKKTPNNVLKHFDFKKIKKEKIKSTLKYIIDVEEKFNQVCICGDLITFDKIIESIDPTKNNNLGIRLAATYGNVEILKKLLEIKNVNPADLDNRAFQDAAKYGNIEIIKILLKDNRVNPVDLNNIAFCKAAENGMAHIINYFLENEIGDPSVYNNRALNLAMDKGYLDIANELLKDNRVSNRIE